MSRDLHDDYYTPERTQCEGYYLGFLVSGSADVPLGEWDDDDGLEPEIDLITITADCADDLEHFPPDVRAEVEPILDAEHDEDVTPKTTPHTFAWLMTQRDALEAAILEAL